MKNVKQYAVVALISSAVTALAFGGCALAYQAQSEAPLMVCSTSMSEAEADFTEVHEFNESSPDNYFRVKIGCKVNQKAGE